MMMRNDYLKQLVEDIHSTTVATIGSEKLDEIFVSIADAVQKSVPSR